MVRDGIRNFAEAKAVLVWGLALHPLNDLCVGCCIALAEGPEGPRPQLLPAQQSGKTELTSGPDMQMKQSVPEMSCQVAVLGL